MELVQDVFQDMNTDQEGSASQQKKTPIVNNFFMINAKDVLKVFISIKIGNVQQYHLCANNTIKTVGFVHLVTMDTSYLKSPKAIALLAIKYLILVGKQIIRLETAPSV